MRSIVQASPWALILACAFIGVVGARAALAPYAVRLLHFHPSPVLSWRDGSSTFQQIFNPTWVEHPPGLLLRSQNCTLEAGTCPGCLGSGAKASVITFSALVSDSDNLTGSQLECRRLLGEPRSVLRVWFGPTV